MTEQKILEMRKDEWAAFLKPLAVEIQLAEKKFPTFPIDPIHAVAIMVEEAGESMQAAIQMVYEGRDVSLLKAELIQTAAMCARAYTMLMREEIVDEQGKKKRN